MRGGIESRQGGTLASGQTITRRVAKVIDCRPIAGPLPAHCRQSIKNILLCALCVSAVETFISKS